MRNLGQRWFTELEFRGEYFSKNPKLFPTPTKTRPQYNNQFLWFFWTVLFLTRKPQVELDFNQYMH